MTPETPETRPFLKWAGGKQWLAPYATQLLPNFSGTYYEPFVGAGSFFFSLASKAAYLGDANQELIDCYRAIRDDVEAVISLLSTYPYDRAFYDRMRGVRPRKPHTKAARFIYLNRAGFNGIYRVNRRGVYNVPFGRYTNPTICDGDRLRSASVALQSATLLSQDFASTAQFAKAGDLVFFDPPYTVKHNNNGFVKYNRHLFSWGDQVRLAKLARELVDRGVVVLIANAAHDDVISLYGGLHKYLVARGSMVSADVESRGPASEVLISSDVLNLSPRQL